MSAPQSAASAAFDLGAYVTAVLFDQSGWPAFALGDGTVQLATAGGLAVVEAHQGAVLCAVSHPSGVGIVTGGDDGAVVWSRLEGDSLAASRIAERKGRWIEAVAASPATGLIAFAAGREVCVLDIADPAFARSFMHDKTVAGLAFDAKGRRLAAASYGGVQLWWSKIAEQKPVPLKWPGGHGAIAWSPDGRFLVSSLQENQLHGWRIADSKDMRMGGYPAKVKSLAFADNGAVLATSGADGAVIWPFSGPNGPMGKEAAEIGPSAAGAKTTCVATAPVLPLVAAGFDDGTVWVAHLKTGRLDKVKTQAGPPISALALSADGSQLAFGDEAGSAGLMRLVGF
jgi:WD40 repeat protein